MSDLLKGGNLLTVAAIGLGASIVGPAIGPRLRPLAKSVIKGAMIALDQGRTAFSKFSLATGDFVAEVRHEMGRGDMITAGEPQEPKEQQHKRRGAPAKSRPHRKSRPHKKSGAEQPSTA
jgi:hypothetical protein